MDLTLLQRKQRPATVGISIKILKEDSEFMKKHNLSPTALFNSKVEELKQKLE